MFTPTRPARVIACLALAATILAGCASGGGAPPQATNATSPRASAAPSRSAAETESTATGGGLCDLVPIEEVETALGMATDGGVGDESIAFGGETCRFTGDTDHVVDVETSEQTRDEWFEAIETVGLTDEVVEGVGEEAYRAAETALGGPGARFTAWADGHEVGVTIYSDQPQDVTFAAAQAIAEAVLAPGQ
jgi:hypothetical protein